MWALNYYLTQLSLGCQSSCQQTPRELETRCGREGHTRPRGPSESPDGVDPNIRRTRKTQRDSHNSGVKIWNLCSVSSTLSYANLEQPFRNLAIKWEVKILLKKSFLRRLLLRLLSLRRYVSSIYMYISAWISRWQCNSSFKVPHLFRFYLQVFLFTCFYNSFWLICYYLLVLPYQLKGMFFYHP